MSDIVERLRSGAAHKTLVTTGLVNQAADEITALRAENEKLKADIDGYINVANEYMAENERLRAALVAVRNRRGVPHTSMMWCDFKCDPCTCGYEAWAEEDAALDQMINTALEEKQ